jgi:DNA-directed RNA polymerase subunit RPC12/RpoP
MDTGIEFVCTVCNREFVAPVEEYKAWSGVVPCPGCGSTDLVQLVSEDDVSCRRGGAAA